MSKLPLKVAVGIRDHWDKDSSPFQKSLAGLKELVGLDVAINPEWPLLLAELGELHPDAGTLVPSVASSAEALFMSLTAILDDEEKYAEWAETLLDQAGGRIRVFIETAKGDPDISWSAEHKAFIITLPKSRIASFSELESIFKAGLVDCFSEKKPTKSLNQTVPLTEEWADVSMDKATGQASLTSTVITASSSKFDVTRIPDISSLPRPDELLQEPPYHLAIYSGSNTVEIHGSHSPSLEFISAYLKKWVRTDHNDTRKPPGIDIKLHQSSMGLGIMYDKVTMEVRPRAYGFSVSPMLVLPLVESRLGYTPVKVTGSSWIFRKDTPFRR